MDEGILFTNTGIGYAVVIRSLPRMEGCTYAHESEQAAGGIGRGLRGRFRVRWSDSWGLKTPPNSRSRLTRFGLRSASQV